MNAYKNKVFKKYNRNFLSIGGIQFDRHYVIIGKIPRQSSWLLRSRRLANYIKIFIQWLVMTIWTRCILPIRGEHVYHKRRNPHNIYKYFKCKIFTSSLFSFRCIECTLKCKFMGPSKTDAKLVLDGSRPKLFNFIN